MPSCSWGIAVAGSLPSCTLQGTPGPRRSSDKCLAEAKLIPSAATSHWTCPYPRKFDFISSCCCFFTSNLQLTESCLLTGCPRAVLPGFAACLPARWRSWLLPPLPLCHGGHRVAPWEKLMGIWELPPTRRVSVVPAALLGLHPDSTWPGCVHLELPVRGSWGAVSCLGAQAARRGRGS